MSAEPFEALIERLEVKFAFTNVSKQNVRSKRILLAWLLLEELAHFLHALRYRFICFVADFF